MINGQQPGNSAPDSNQPADAQGNQTAAAILAAQTPVSDLV